MPQSGRYTAVLDKIKGRGTADISLEELKNQTKAGWQKWASWGSPRARVGSLCHLLPAGAALQLPASTWLQKPHTAPWQEAFLNPVASRRSSAEKTFVPTLRFTASVGEVLQTSSFKHKCLKISILLIRQIISLINVVKISKSLEGKRDPQESSRYQTHAAYFSVPLQVHSFGCVGSGFSVSQLSYL